jgi:hypothetical protein
VSVGLSEQLPGTAIFAVPQHLIGFFSRIGHESPLFSRSSDTNKSTPNRTDFNYCKNIRICLRGETSFHLMSVLGPTIRIYTSGDRGILFEAAKHKMDTQFRPKKDTPVLKLRL